MTLEFQPWPKIARLNRDITITEKLDGTNAAVVIVPLANLDHIGGADGQFVELFAADASKLVSITSGNYAVFAQSRTRFITPENDNYGFAGWVNRNAEALVSTLGEGTHFGEWWGAGIQRKYGFTGGEKHFSLFNTKRHADRVIDTTFEDGTSLDIVPVLYEGPFHQTAIDRAIRQIRDNGSVAAPGFGRPEGIVIFHHASREMYKVTLEGDQPTEQQRAAKHAFDDERIAA